MRKALILSAIALWVLPMAFLAFEVFAGESADKPQVCPLPQSADISERYLDESAQSNIRRSEEDMPGLTSGKMSDYLLLTHRERDTVRHAIIRWWTPDTIEGRVHSNDCIYISPSNDRPVFKKRVTTSCGIEPENHHARFDQGWDYAAPIIFPDSAASIRENAALWLGTQGTDSLIQFVLSENQIRWRKCGLRNVNGIDSIACYPTTIADAYVDTIPSSGVIFVEGKLWISASRGRPDIMDGEFPERAENYPGAFVSDGFNGNLTIGCSDTLLITDNLIYKHARYNRSVPPDIDSCAEVLGLVSEKFIMMHRQVRDSLYINAALATVAGSISVQDMYSPEPADTTDEKDLFYICGSLAQRNRGIMHTNDFPPGYNRGFISKKYDYDVRLLTNPPPFFPPALRSSHWDRGDEYSE